MINNISFKGYDARELKGLMCTDKNCADAINRTLQNSETPIDIFTPQINSRSTKKEYEKLMELEAMNWAQDYMNILPSYKNMMLFDNSRKEIKEILKAIADGIKKTFDINPVAADVHIRGGNFFICENNYEDEMIIGEGECKYPNFLCKKIFGVSDIHEIPKLDYHIDLFLRPLDNGNILVADDESTIKGLQEGSKKIQNYINTHNLSTQESQQMESVIKKINLALEKFVYSQELDPYKQKEKTNKVITRLKNANYNPIKVPGNYYHLETDYGVNTYKKYENNFINAISYKKDGKIIYITNAPMLDNALGITPEIETKTGFSTKNMFIESIAPYIDKENIHFIDEKTTRNLFNNYGGIHCTAAEMPE